MKSKSNAVYTNASICFYTKNKTLISCNAINYSIDSNINIPSETYYFRSSINKINNIPIYEICKKGNQGIIDSFNNLNDTLTQDNLNDSDIANKLKFDNITDNSLGPFATFLTIPLTWIQNILASDQVCRDIVLPLPYTSINLTLPCMTEFWNKLGLLGSLVSALWLCVVGVRIFNGLFLLTVDTISSKDNEDELTKIKSWEL